MAHQLSARRLQLQLADSTPEPIVALANDPLFASGVDALDLNLGCPQMVARRGDFGAFLVENHGVAYVAALARHVVTHVRVPVSAKLRLYRDVPVSDPFFSSHVFVGMIDLG